MIRTIELFLGTKSFRTGTQGIKTGKDRGAIPPALFEELLICINKDEVQL